MHGRTLQSFGPSCSSSDGRSLHAAAVPFGGFRDQPRNSRTDRSQRQRRDGRRSQSVAWRSGSPIHPTHPAGERFRRRHSFRTLCALLLCLCGLCVQLRNLGSTTRHWRRSSFSVFSFRLSSASVTCPIRRFLAERLCRSATRGAALPVVRSRRVRELNRPGRPEGTTYACCGNTVSATVESKRSRRRTRSKAWCGASERDQWGRGRHTGAGRHGAADDVGQLWRGGRMARSVRPGLRNECRPLAGPGDGAPGGWWAPCCPLK